MADEIQVACNHCKELIKKGAKKCPHCQTDLRGFFGKHPILALLFIIFLVPMFIAAISGNNQPSNITTVNTQTPVVNKKIPTTKTTSQSVKEAKVDYVNQIETVLNVAVKDGATVFDSKSNLATADSKPPFEVIVNTDRNDVSDCFAAKMALVKTMKVAYGNPDIKDKISRVLITTPFLDASLGYNDAKDLKDLQNAMPTNFWKMILQYRPYKNEVGDMKNRTWGEKKSDCE